MFQTKVSKRIARTFQTTVGNESSHLNRMGARFSGSFRSTLAVAFSSTLTASVAFLEASTRSNFLELEARPEAERTWWLATRWIAKTTRR
ncbi:hypothetical protein PsorP6_009810 [Peronosclerospora sorghi]|uniref:Uncharacterized protein n=1 Tax=Peronosclerospora sorghi TaxID=230839 RepID=A0ACC0VYS0_9STRA|nr:hypothetical protein PsorP6_009810 [Peronosclerospora sorghi]